MSCSAYRLINLYSPKSDAPSLFDACPVQSSPHYLESNSLALTLFWIVVEGWGISWWNTTQQMHFRWTMGEEERLLLLQPFEYNDAADDYELGNCYDLMDKRHQRDSCVVLDDDEATGGWLTGETRYNLCRQLKWNGTVMSMNDSQVQDHNAPFMMTIILLLTSNGQLIKWSLYLLVLTPTRWFCDWTYDPRRDDYLVLLPDIHVFVIH